MTECQKLYYLSPFDNILDKNMKEKPSALLLNCYILTLSDVLAQQVNRRGKMMQICLDFAGVYCGEIFQAIMKNCPGIGVVGAGRGAAGWCCGTSTSALPRRAALGHSLPVPWCQKLPCTAQLLGAFPPGAAAGGAGWAQVSLGPLAGAPWQPWCCLCCAWPGGCTSGSNDSLGQHWDGTKPQLNIIT